MNKRFQKPIKPPPPLSEENWEPIFEQLKERYSRAISQMSSVEFYAVATSYLDGGIVLAGSELSPFLCGVIVYGHRSGEDLSNYFLGKMPGFIATKAWGTTYAEPPWIAVGAFKFAGIVDKSQIENMFHCFKLVADRIIANGIKKRDGGEL